MANIPLYATTGAASETSRSRKRQNTVQSGFLSLRALTFSMMLTVAILPIALIYSWIGRTAFEQELKRVDESHLVIAKNLSSTLSRYAADSIEVFEAALTENADIETFSKLLAKFDISNVMRIDAEGRLVSGGKAGDLDAQGLPTLATIAELRDLTARKPGETVVSGIRGSERGSHFFIAKALEGGQLAIARWGSDYVIKLQKSIAFGELGHSMMVDRNGLVVAHPNPEWQRVRKDASKLSVVQAMMSGDTGVMQFYSPPMAADMIAGYTFVPETGWGVMVPQPLRELVARAEAIQMAALYVSSLGVAMAVMAGLVFSRVLTAQIRSLAASAKRIASGDLSARADAMSWHTPVEIRTLSQSFDDMAEDIEIKSQRLNQQLVVEKALSVERAGLLTDAKRAFEMKSQFVSTISHELRTPLTSIRGSIELVLSGGLGPLNPKVSNLLTVGKRNTDRLLSLVNDILDFSGLEAKELTMNMKRVPARHILNDAVEMNAAFSEASGIKLVAYPILADFDLMVDKRRMHQVLTNLISNAVKFSGSGKVVELSAELTADYGIFRVRDYGIGISKAFQSQIFDRFTQEDSSDSRQAGGTGLGLAISKGIVETHGGVLAFETEVGKGTTFVLKVPLV